MQIKEVIFDTIYIGDYSCYDADDDTIQLTVEVLPQSQTSPIVRSICNEDSKKTVNNVIVEQSELCIVSRNRLENYIDFEINENGELIIHGKDAQKYSINENGELIYTE